MVQAAAGDAVLHGLPLTPEEKDLAVRGLRWVGEPHDLAEARVVDPLERAELAARWRFEPAPPAGDGVERFLVKFCRREPEAKAWSPPGATAPTASASGSGAWSPPPRPTPGTCGAWP